ncbi:MAG: hypothetical protein ACR2KT_16970 [Methylocella sp.]
MMSAFASERSFRPILICESLKFIYRPGTEGRTSEEEVLQRGKDLIKSTHADLLLFGDVRERDKAVKIYAMNEHGDCNLHPKPTIIETGDLPQDFNSGRRD